MNLPFTLPDWLPWWAALPILVVVCFYALAVFVMPFSVLGVKPRLASIEARLDEIQGEIRSLALRLPEPGRRGEMPRQEERPPVPPRAAAAPAVAEERPRMAPPPLTARPVPSVPRAGVPTPPRVDEPAEAELPVSARQAGSLPPNWLRSRAAPLPPVTEPVPEPSAGEEEAEEERVVPPPSPSALPSRLPPSLRRSPPRVTPAAERGEGDEAPRPQRAEPRIDWPR
jgi:hypothetical protein